jgi:hypothetical protein
MHPKSTTQRNLDRVRPDGSYFGLDRAESAADGADLILELLPNGESAWLRPARPSCLVAEACLSSSDDARFIITDAGRDQIRRDAAMQALFGRPWPTVAEVGRIGVCPDCHMAQTTPSCDRREHCL